MPIQPIVPGLPQPLGEPDGIAKPIAGQVNLWGVWLGSGAGTVGPPGPPGPQGPPGPAGSGGMLVVNGDVPVGIICTPAGEPIYT